MFYFTVRKVKLNKKFQEEEEEEEEHPSPALTYVHQNYRGYMII
jgi:hypothetical protein